MADEVRPYVGPRPFEASDAGLFFGRDSEADDLVSLIVAHREVLLYAESGAGKTSIINAKLVALLKDEGFEILPAARLRTPLPPNIASAEVKNLYAFNVLLAWAPGTSVNDIAHTSLSEFLSRRQPITDEDGLPRPRIAIFDQFEEVFELYADRLSDTKDFFQQVHDALMADPRMRVLFAIREDYIAQLESFATLLPERLRVRFRLERLRKSGAIAAVLGPLRNTGRSFADGVAEALVQDLLKIRLETSTGEIREVLGHFVEPVQLQVVCHTLWQQLPPATTIIRLDDLIAAGGPDRALAMFYESAIKAASDASGLHQNEIRNWCEEWLVTSTGTRGFVHRGRDLTQGLLNTALDVLESNHLVRSEVRAGARWYELTHDRFVGPIRASNEIWKREQEEKGRDAAALLSKSQFIAKGEEALRYAIQSADLCKEIGDWDGYVMALINVAWGYESDGRTDKALVTYDEGLRYKELLTDQQVYSFLLLRVASCLHSTEDFTGAIHYLTEYISSFPDDFHGYRERGAAFWYSGQYDLAINDYTAVLDQTTDLEAYNGRGQVFAEAGKFELAITDLDLAVQLAQNDPIIQSYARNGRALAYGGMRKFRLSLKEFALCIRVSPNNAWIYFNRAQVYEWMRKYDKAAKDYRQSLELGNPRLNPLKRQIAQEWLKRNQTSSA